MHALNNGKLRYCNNYDCYLYVRESVSSYIILTESYVHVPVHICLNGVRIACMKEVHTFFQNDLIFLYQDIVLLIVLIFLYIPPKYTLVLYQPGYN